MNRQQSNQQKWRTESQNKIKISKSRSIELPQIAIILRAILLSKSSHSTTHLVLLSESTHLILLWKSTHSLRRLNHWVHLIHSTTHSTHSHLVHIIHTTTHSHLAHSHHGLLWHSHSHSTTHSSSHLLLWHSHRLVHSTTHSHLAH